MEWFEYLEPIPLTTITAEQVNSATDSFSSLTTPIAELELWRVKSDIYEEPKSYLLRFFFQIFEIEDLEAFSFLLKPSSATTKTKTRISHWEKTPRGSIRVFNESGTLKHPQCPLKSVQTVVLAIIEMAKRGTRQFWISSIEDFLVTTKKEWGPGKPCRAGEPSTRRKISVTMDILQYEGFVKEGKLERKNLRQYFLEKSWQELEKWILEEFGS